MATKVVHPEPSKVPVLSGGSSSSALIGKAVMIRGDIYSNEDLYVDGDLEGSLEAVEYKLTIGPNATLRASVKAREIVVLGTIHGNVEAAEKIEIRKDAKLVGDIRTARIVIEDGAYIKGSIEIVRACSPLLALLGSPEADAADARGEQDIRERRFITLDDTNSLGRVLFKEPDEHAESQSITESEPTSAGRGRH